MRQTRNAMRDSYSQNDKVLLYICPLSVYNAIVNAETELFRLLLKRICNDSADRRIKIRGERKETRETAGPDSESHGGQNKKVTLLKPAHFAGTHKFSLTVNHSLPQF